MTINHPYFLLFLLLFPLPFLIKNRSFCFRFSSFTILPKDGFSSAVNLIAKALLSITIVFLTLGLCGIETKKEEVSSIPQWQKGALIIYILDSSASMTGAKFTDGRKKRDVAFDILENFVLEREKDYAALIIFGDRPILIQPPTFNKERTAETIRFLKKIKQSLGGTTIDTAIAKALSLINESDSPYDKAIVFLSDGEGTIEKPIRDQLAFLLKEFDIKFYWIKIPEDQPKEYAEKWDEEETKDMRALMTELGSSAKVFNIKNPREIKKAFAEIGKLEKGLIEYKEQKIITQRFDKIFYKAAFCGLTLFSLFIFLLITATSYNRSEEGVKNG